MNTQQTRAAHIAWTKERALAELDAGSVVNAMASVTSDLGKHPETQGHGAITLMMTLAMDGQLGNEREMRDFIGGIQ